MILYSGGNIGRGRCQNQKMQRHHNINRQEDERA